VETYEDLQARVDKANTKRAAISRQMTDALSAAPAGGRVLFRRRIETDFDETIRFWEYDESGERRYVGELYEPIADWAFDFKPKILTITEAPPSADEE